MGERSNSPKDKTLQTCMLPITWTKNIWGKTDRPKGEIDKYTI